MGDIASPSVKEKEESNEWSQDSTDDQLLHELAKAKIHSDGDRDINHKDDDDERKSITAVVTTGNQINDILNETKHHYLETGKQISAASNPQQSAKSKSGKNEEKKIFVGGISWDTTEEDLKNFFSQFGDVSNVQIKYDHFTGRSRGFAFVEFLMPEACQKSLQSKEYDLKNKKIEIKPAKSRENKKIFVGGLPADFIEEELRKHFDQFGKIEEIEWPFDKFQNRRKNFAFIVFEDEDSTQKAAAQPKQKFGDRTCDVKIAVPQYMRPQRPYNMPPVAYGTGWSEFAGYGAYGSYGGGYGAAAAAAALSATGGPGTGGGGGYYDDYYNSYDYGAAAAAAASHNQVPTQATYEYNNWQTNTAAAGYDAWNYSGMSTNASGPAPTANQSRPSVRGGYAGYGGY